MKLTALSIALVAALGMTAGCSTQSPQNQASRPGASLTEAHSQYSLGRFYQGQERYDLAIEAYRRALAADPAHVSAYNGLGASLLLSGRNAEAIEQFKAGLQIQPRSAALWNNLGYAYALSGENKLAEVAYKQSLDLDPTDYKTNTNLAVVQQSAPPATPAPAASTLASAQPEPAQTSAAPIHAAPANTTQVASAAVIEQAPVAPLATTPASAPIDTAPAGAAQTASAVPAQATPAEAGMQLQPSTELAKAYQAPAAVQVVEVAPRVYELDLPDTGAASAPGAQLASVLAPVAGTTRISVPLREEAIQTASAGSADFVLEIRNGNGVRRMAWRTSQYLAGQGYTTKRLTNQRGFNVKVTRIFYLPGYLEEATKLLTHLPKDTVLTETSNMRRGIHVRVVLGKDMVRHQASLDSATTKTQLAAL